MQEPYELIGPYYGSHQPEVFCEEYSADLEDQGLSAYADIILDEAADPERAICAWMDILDKFIPEEGWHIGYIGASQALYAIPDGWEELCE